MLEQVRDTKDDLEEEDPLRWNAKSDDGRKPNREGEEEFTRVEAKGGRHVKARVGVMYLVEAPEERQLVVGAVPEVGDGVEPEDAHRDRYQRAGAQVSKQPESPLRGPDGDDPAADDRDDEGVDSPETQVRAPGGTQSLVGSPALQRQSDDPRRGQGQASRKLVGGFSGVRHRREYRIPLKESLAGSSR